MHNFREAAGNGAGGWAEAGQELLPVLPNHHTLGIVPQLWHPVFVEQVISSVQSQQPFFSRSLILEYSTALATAPLVLLVSPDPHAAAALARGFAQAVVGESPQLTVVSNAGWHHATGENQYYHAVQQRFRTLRCQEIGQEATEPYNTGKAFFVCFESLQTHELAEHFQSFQAEPQIALSAVVPWSEVAAAARQFPGAALVTIRAPYLEAGPSACPPPVGLQRLWLQARLNGRANQTPARSSDRRWLMYTQSRESLPARGLWPE